MGQFIDLTGRRFGKLTVLYLGPKTKDNRTTWICKCDCGNIVNAMRQSLIAGTTKVSMKVQNENKRPRNTCGGVWHEIEPCGRWD